VSFENPRECSLARGKSNILRIPFIHDSTNTVTWKFFFQKVIEETSLQAKCRKEVSM
jgi:hypothetical protein